MDPTMPGNWNPELKGLDPRELIEGGLQSRTKPAAWEPPTPGELSRLLPQYEIDALLGRGGMGAVYRGQQATLDRRVAIKLLPAEMAADTEFVARFKREARTLAKLHHPGIVMVHDFGQTSEGHLYFVMEFVDGTDLYKIIHGPGLDCAQALEIIGQICDALQYAHSEGVVHRDIKPANVIMALDGRVKLADFGLARPTDDSSGAFTRTNVVMGTPDYMAPEAIAGEADHRADLYSLGVMLYEMLTGKPPRGAWGSVSQQVRVDVRLDEVVVRALQENPDLRYQQASEIKTAVDVIRSTPLPKGKGPNPTKKHSSNKKGSLLAGIAALVITCVLCVGAFQALKDREPGVVEPEPGLDQQGAEPMAANPVRLEFGKVGDEFENGMEMKFCWIPAGKFTMGSPEDEPERQALKEAQVEVELTRGFWLGKYEVTQEDYEEIAGINPAKFQAVGKRAPVEEISWEEAVAYCKKLTDRERNKGTLPNGWAYTLPSEAQWEYACRAGEKGPYSGGDLDEMGWYQENSGGKAHEVGEKKANAWGLYDMYGNVREWCQDWMTDKLTGGKDPTGPLTGATRVMRGGSWYNTAGFCRSAHRSGGAVGRNGRRGDLGLRVCLKYLEGQLTRARDTDKAEAASANPIDLLAAADPTLRELGDSSSSGEPASATKDNPFENSLGMRFVPVPITGGPTGGNRVLFSIWETRVEDYEAFIKEKSGREWAKPDFPQADNHPVVNVSWEDAVAFCEWLTGEERKNGKIGKDQRYRLPTDHEWSSAVGIGKDEDAGQLPAAKNNNIADVFPWGRDWPPPKGEGNYFGMETKNNPIPGRQPMEGYQDHFDRSAPVGSFEADEHGLHDLGGNVWEWCEDWFSSEQKRRVRRGGAWIYGSRHFLLSSTRGYDVPGSRNYRGGFRCVLVSITTAPREPAIE
jgi:formylglycine-generating enzyme required for sulfatase activity